MKTLRLISSDFKRYRAHGLPPHYVVLMQGFWACCFYRISHSWLAASPPTLGKLLRFPSRVVQTLSEALTGICLPPACSIGPGLHISHFNVFVGTTAHIGRHCSLHQGVTIGRAHKTGSFPCLGDRVFVGANALIWGEIHIGDDAVVGAGAVVTHSIPPRAVVVGNPAKIVSYKGSFDLIRYEGIETDIERCVALPSIDTSKTDGETVG